MDFLGIKTYFSQLRYRYSAWCKIVRGQYTNKDLVADWLHLVVTLILSALVILR